MVGELEEIKNDISSFRCVVLDAMKKMAQGHQAGQGFMSPQLQDPFSSPDISRQLPPRNRLDFDLRMASLENRVTELTDSFTEFFSVARDALKESALTSNGDDRARLADMCKSQ